MDSGTRESGGRDGVTKPGGPPRDPADPIREEPSFPSKQDDFSLLLERHKKTLDLLAE